MKKKQTDKQMEKFEANIVNSLTQLTSLMAGFPTSPTSSIDTFYYNNRWNLISNNRNICTEMYIEHGIVQTLVDQPVDDAFRAGFDIKTNQLDANEIEKLQIFCEENFVIEEIMQALKWNRLYGGAGLITVVDQDPASPLNINAIKANTPLKFRAADEWELFFANVNISSMLDNKVMTEFFDYYGVTIHHSRVQAVRGKTAPSLRRPQLRGWGMSELERLVRSVNQYLKNQDVIFELLDEAKIDVYRINGFVQSLMTSNGTNSVAKRLQNANLQKNYNNALVMDKEDEYDQKQMAFTGLAEMLKEIRIQIASDLKMPVTKLFGLSSAGFNSGEDDIENYNSMIEAEIRNKCKFIVMRALKICCKKLFDVVPDDLMINWKPLRMLGAEQEENVKNQKMDRVIKAFQAGLMTDIEAKSAMNKDSLLPVEIDEAESQQLTFGDSEDFEIEKGAVV